ncbi:hypothetical protein [Amycolatopsis thermophila]|uniref:Uncharacterized protein n=1 Tax=Amycolatopsis thermophila TaxID=206084 RepID=A0ABU0ENE1_9PSEU|nr:hypothetical protein [Amycolatopsis thermophila]MDQ0376521.1 hypothetical protein [Amycolatopsis thermophila]
MENENTEAVDTSDAEPLDSMTAARLYLDKAAELHDQLANHTGNQPALLDAAARIGQGYAQLAVAERIDRPAVFIVNTPDLDPETAAGIVKQLQAELSKTAPGLSGGGTKFL